MSNSLFEFDSQTRAKHKAKFICGIDETGRGCWAGPLVASAVIYDESNFIEGINDSKKLTKKNRLFLADKIKNECLSWGIAEVSPEEIDKKGLTYANEKAMVDAAIIAISKLNLTLENIDLFIIDQSPCKKLNPMIMMPKADSISASVASASILAKVYRDKIIEEIAQAHPNYGFEEHNGYINEVHVDKVKKYGLIDKIHRKSYVVAGFNKPKQISLLDLENEN